MVHHGKNGFFTLVSESIREEEEHFTVELIVSLSILDVFMLMKNYSAVVRSINNYKNLFQ